MIDGYDSTKIANIPRDAPAIVCYCDLKFGFTLGQVRQQFPHLILKGRVVALAAGSDLCGHGVDTEPGNVGVDGAARSIKSRIDRGDHRPVGYADLSDMHRLISALHLLGVPTPPPGPGRPWRCYTAHPTGVKHICGPHTCGQLPIDADSTQWWWSSMQNPGGPDLDRNVFREDFFQAVAAPPTPSPHPIQEKDDMIHAILNHDGRLEVFVEKPDTGEVFHAYQTAPGAGWEGSAPGRNAEWFSLGAPGAKAPAPAGQ